MHLNYLRIITLASPLFPCQPFTLPSAPKALLHSTKLFTSSVTDDILPPFTSLEDYLSYLSTRASLPSGFLVSSSTTTFIPPEAPSMGPLPIRSTLIYLPDGPTTSWSAIFTKNRFPGAPVTVGKTRLGKPLQAIVVNNKVSNVCSRTGVEDSLMVCDAVARALELPLGEESVLPSSTGVIGWKLPSEELSGLIPQVVEGLQGESAMTLAQGIMTTDRYPKLRSVELSSGARIVGCAKGAGMIEPNMATMLCYILTDASVEEEDWNGILTPAADVSFNAISIDGDESTSDTVVLISSDKIKSDVTEFREALTTLCQSLAADLVRNGEGTSHVIRITLTNYAVERKTAIKLGRKIVNSPLFKCAVAGNDPNIGRLAAAVGSFLGKMEGEESVDASKISFSIGDDLIFSNGVFQIDGDETETKLSGYMKQAQFDEHEKFPSHQKFVEIGVDFGEETGESVVVLGSDLTAEYVSINADYRS